MPVEPGDGAGATRASGLSKRALLLTIAQGSLTAAVVGKSMLLTRWLDREAFGTFREVVLLAQTIPWLLNLGLPDGIFYFGAPLSPHRRRVLIARSYLMLTLAGAFAVAALYALRENVATWMNNSALSGYSLLAGLYVGACLYDALTVAVLVVTEQAKALAVLSVIHAVYDVGAVAIAWYADTSLTVVLILAIGGLGLKSLGAAVLALGSSHKSQPGAGEWDDSARVPGPKTEFAYCLPLALAGAFAWLRRSAARFIVSGTHGPAEFAVFERGAVEVPFVAVITLSIARAILPEMVRFWKGQRVGPFVSLWKRAVRKSALVIWPIAGMMAVLAERVIVLLYSQRYAESTPIFRIFLVLLPLRVAIFGYVLRACGLSVQESIVAGLGLLVNVAFGWELCVAIGPAGAAWGAVIGEVFTVVVLLVLIGRATHVGFRELLPWGDLGRLAAALVVPTAVGLILERQLAGLVTGILAVGVVFTVLYILGGRLCGAIQDDDIQMVRSWLPASLQRRR